MQRAEYNICIVTNRIIVCGLQQDQMPGIAIANREDAPGGAQADPRQRRQDAGLRAQPAAPHVDQPERALRLGYPDGNACEDAGRQDERRNRAGVSEADGCDYCLDAHSFTAGKLAKIPADEIELNRECRWGDPKRQAAVAFAKALIETRGKAPKPSLRRSGMRDGQTPTSSR